MDVWSAHVMQMANLEGSVEELPAEDSSITAWLADL